MGITEPAGSPSDSVASFIAIFHVPATQSHTHSSMGLNGLIGAPLSGRRTSEKGSYYCSLTAVLLGVHEQYV